MIKNIALKALLAGMLIGIGCVVYLNLKPVNSIVAAVAFSIALVSIVALELNLYTGKVGYLVYSTKKNIVDNIANLLLILSCNIVGVLTNNLLSMYTCPTINATNKKAYINQFFLFFEWLRFPHTLKSFLACSAQQRIIS